MSIHSTTYHTAGSSSSNVEDNRAHPIDERVKGVAFDILLPKTPVNAEQVRFKLDACEKTGSGHYTIVEWEGKKYRITVYKDKSRIGLSEGEWNNMGKKMTSLWDKFHPSQHFSNGTLHMQPKTKKKWNVQWKTDLKVEGKNDSTHIERTVSQRVIKEFKELFENQLKPLNSLSSPKSSSRKLESDFLTQSTFRSNRFKAEKKEPIFKNPKEIFEQIKNYLRSLRKAPEQTAVIDEKKTAERRESIFEQSKQFANRAKNHLFPSSSTINEFNDLSSETNSIAEPADDPDELDLNSDTTSLGGVSDITDILKDEGPPYSSQVNIS